MFRRVERIETMEVNISRDLINRVEISRRDINWLTLLVYKTN